MTGIIYESILSSYGNISLFRGNIDIELSRELKVITTYE